MSKIYVVETLDAAPGKIDELKQGLIDLTAHARKEKGCLYYDLYLDRARPFRFCVLMCFENQKAYDHHTNSSHIQQFMEKYDTVVYHNVVEDLYDKLL